MFELAVKLVHYEPPLRALFSMTTPREFVVWAHRLFPVFAFAAVSIKHVLFIDLEKHRARQLAHMLAQNEVRLTTGRPKLCWSSAWTDDLWCMAQVTKQELGALEQSLVGDDDALATDDTPAQ